MRVRGRRARSAIAGTVALAGCALAACGSSAEEAGGAGEVDGSTIVLQTVAALEPQFKEYAAAYMEEFPDRKVEVRAATEDPAEYAEQLATARLGGELPDLFFTLDHLVNTLAENKVSLDLAPGIEEGKLGDLTLDDFLPQFVDLYRPLSSPDEVTGLPVSADSVALFYNRSLFDEVGVTEYPEPDWTWADMLRVAEEIQTKSGGSVTGLAAPLKDGSNQIVYGPLINAFGGYVYDAENQTSGIGQPEAIKAWKLLISAYGTASGEYTTTADDPTLKFQSGSVAMALVSRAAVPQTKTALGDADWDVQVPPSVDGEVAAGGGAYGLSISQTSESQDAAWAFLAWFFDTNGGMKVVQEVSGAIPPTEDGLADGAWQEASPPPENYEIFGDTARDAVMLTQLPQASAGVMTEATVQATQEVVLEGRDVAEAFKAAEDKVNASLAEGQE